MSKLKLLFITVLVISATSLFFWSTILFKKSTSNEIVLNTFEEEEDYEQKRINHEERMKHEFKMLKNPTTGEIPKGVRLKSVEKALKVSSFKLPSKNLLKALPTITVTERGPNNYGGRTRALGFDVRDNDIVLAGGVTSGILRSTDGGATWTQVTPAGEIHSINCFAQDTRSGHEDTWYAGTGEISSSANAIGAAYHGYGIYKSTDNGQNWTALANTQGGDLESFDNDFDFVSRIVVNPTNGDVLATAINSVQRSDNGGNSWNTELGNPSNLLRTDLVYNTVSGKFYAAIDGRDPSNNAGIWESSDGDNWTRIRTEADLSSMELGRIILANVANTDDIVVMFEMLNDFTCTNFNTTKTGLVHYDGTSNWTDHTDKIGDCTDKYTAANALPTQLELQGGYNMALATKPDDADIVYLGGTEAYRYNLSTNAYEFIGGSQLEANTQNLHVDQHLFMFEPSSNNIMWSCNDGGVRETDVTGTITATIGNHDNGFIWTSRNSGYNGYQYYGVDIDPADGSNFLAGGAQDNAFTIQPTDATADEVGPTADGVDVGIISGGSNFTTHNFFQMWQNGSMHRFENGSIATNPLNPAATGFVGHLYLDADNTNYLYYPASNPSNALYRTRIAESINSASVTGNSETGWENMTGVNGAISNPISAMDASRDIQYDEDYSASDTDRKLYIGTEGGKVFRLSDPAFTSASTVPMDITPTNMSGNGYVSDIAVNPLNDNEILVTYSNYGVNSVWHTSDASVANPVWTNVEGASGSSVELASARCALITKSDGSMVYMVGTSTGLYATDALSGATTSWTRIGSNEIGLAVCVEMRLRTSDNKVALGTHGNGMFMLSFPGLIPVELTTFTGTVTEQNDVLLAWTTASEINNAGFDVERSKNGETFEKIGFVEGNDNSITRQSYHFIDERASTGTWYYRLKQIDHDGQFEYSNVVSIRIETATSTSVSLYPNPTLGSLTIAEGQGMITIYNLNGQPVFQFTNSQPIRQIPTDKLTKGIYILQLVREDGTTMSKRFAKQ